MLVLDVDATEGAEGKGEPDCGPEALRGALTAALPGVAWAAHTTASSRPKCWRYRLVVPLDRAVDRAVYLLVTNGLRAVVRDGPRPKLLEADAQSQGQAERLWFVPGLAADYHALSADGAPLDVGAWRSRAGEMAGEDLPAPLEPEATRPPREEVAALWRTCAPVTDDGPAKSWCVARRLMVSRAAEMNLVRALPAAGPLPSWARFQGKDWREAGYHAVLPLFDARGELVSLRARWTGTRWDDATGFPVEVPRGGPKSLNPAGYRTAGLVLACPVGRWLLCEGPSAVRGAIADTELGPVRWDGTVWLFEGDAHALFAIMSGRVERLCPACQGAEVWWDRSWRCPCGWFGADTWGETGAFLGYGKGAFTAELAARLPSSAEVWIFPDHDADRKGEALARGIADLLGARCPVKVVPWDREVRHG